MSLKKTIQISLALASASLLFSNHGAIVVEAARRPVELERTLAPFSSERMVSWLLLQEKTPTIGQLPIPEGKGKDTTIKACGNCHSTDIFAGQRHTRVQWNGIIDNMVSKGLESSDEDLDTILNYLTASFPPADKPAEQAKPSVAIPHPAK